MSWGTKIAVLYLSFVGLIVGLAITCFGENVELESKDYYAKELKFQDQLNAENNANALGMAIEHRVLDKAVEITVPQELLGSDLKGSVTFFRPSDSTKDKTIALNLDEKGKQLLSDPGFIKGVYRMKISISSKGKNYYKENVINL